MAAVPGRGRGGGPPPVGGGGGGGRGGRGQGAQAPAGDIVIAPFEIKTTGSDKEIITNVNITSEKQQNADIIFKQYDLKVKEEQEMRGLGNELRLTLFDSIRVPTGSSLPLSEIAVQAFKHLALYTQLIVNKHSTEGPTDEQVKKMQSSSERLIGKLRDEGPSSIYTVLKGAYTDKPLGVNEGTERLILLCLMAERPSLIPRILSEFPQVTDPITIGHLLEPYTNPDMDAYLETYATAQDPLFSSLRSGIRKGIASMGKLRLQQNILLRDMIKVRYSLVNVVVDPSIFSVRSLEFLQPIIQKIKDIGATPQDQSQTIYSKFKPAAELLLADYESVLNLLKATDANIKDAVRKLNLVLSTMKQSDILFDKLSAQPAV